ncbi:unnamed protein product, partial [Allacma fusca]
AGEQKSFSSHPVENFYQPSPVYEPVTPKATPVPYEGNPLFRHQFPGGGGISKNETSIAYRNEGAQMLPLANNSTTSQSLTKDPYAFEIPASPDGMKSENGEEGKEEIEGETSKESDEESSDESDEEEESGEEGSEGSKGADESGKEEEETSSEAGGAGGGGAGGGPGGTPDTKVGAQNFINLIGTDFQPGRLVNIFFGLVLLMFMMIAQGYMMWVFGIAFLPGTRSLNDWEFNPEALDRALDILNGALDLWQDKRDDIEKIISFATNFGE